jgi:hypothetical protein
VAATRDARNPVLRGVTLTVPGFTRRSSYLPPISRSGTCPLERPRKSIARCVHVFLSGESDMARSMLASRRLAD